MTSDKDARSYIMKPAIWRSFKEVKYKADTRNLRPKSVYCGQFPQDGLVKVKVLAGRGLKDNSGSQPKAKTPCI